MIVPVLLMPGPLSPFSKYSVINLRMQYSDCGKHMDRNTDVGYEIKIGQTDELKMS